VRHGYLRITLGWKIVTRACNVGVEHDGIRTYRSRNIADYAKHPAQICQSRRHVSGLRHRSCDVDERHCLDCDTSSVRQDNVDICVVHVEVLRFES